MSKHERVDYRPKMPFDNELWEFPQKCCYVDCPIRYPVLSFNQPHIKKYGFTGDWLHFECYLQDISLWGRFKNLFRDKNAKVS